jgi:uroporphyrinogen decarboxylase
MHRRRFLLGTASAGALIWRPIPAFGKAALNCKERVDRALKGADLDRPPFCFWHHFGLKTPEAHARATLDFHRRYRTDIVKVMSDFPYPKGAGKWYELKPVDDPFPDQIQALKLIRDGLNGHAYFIETVFNSWNVAEKLSSKDEVTRLSKENPQALLAALDAITQSQIKHVKRALGLGASGILLSIANANRAEISLDNYRRFSASFDKRILKAASGSKVTFLHLHVEEPYLPEFRDFDFPIINYSVKVSGIPISTVRQMYSSVIAGGIDEVDYKKLTVADIRTEIKEAREAAGLKFILTPGCSVPNDSTEAELLRLPEVLGA